VQGAVASEAKDELGRRADLGDVQACLELGRRLLVGNDADFSPEQGAHYLREASALGSPDAAHLYATLAAAGIGRRQDWSEALDYLQRAAERNHASAAAELELLASAWGGDFSSASTPSELRDGVDLERWLTPPPRTALTEAPRVRSIGKFLPPSVCGWLVRRAAGRLQPATMFNPVTERNEPHPRRTNSAFLFDVLNADVVVALLRARISAAVQIPAPCFEPTQIFHYAAGQEIGPHFDYLEHRRMRVLDTAEPYEGQRIATFLIYLNDGYEGGETVFPKAGVRFRGNQGDALYFANVDRDGRPDPLSLHAGEPPRRGEKWIVSQWIHDRPFTGVGPD
jgi:hypothetical protein